MSEARSDSAKGTTSLSRAAMALVTSCAAGILQSQKTCALRWVRSTWPPFEPHFARLHICNSRRRCYPYRQPTTAQTPTPRLSSKIERIKVERIMPLLCASALVRLEQTIGQKLESALVKSSVKLLMHIDACRYDETPLATTTKHVGAPVHIDLQRRRLASRLPGPERWLGTDLGTTEVFQRECGWWVFSEGG